MPKRKGKGKGKTAAAAAAPRSSARRAEAVEVEKPVPVPVEELPPLAPPVAERGGSVPPLLVDEDGMEPLFLGHLYFSVPRRATEKMYPGADALHEDGSTASAPMLMDSNWMLYIATKAEAEAAGPRALLQPTSGDKLPRKSEYRHVLMLPYWVVRPHLALSAEYLFDTGKRRECLGSRPNFYNGGGDRISNTSQFDKARLARTAELTANAEGGLDGGPVGYTFEREHTERNSNEGPFVRISVYLMANHINQEPSLFPEQQIHYWTHHDHLGQVLRMLLFTAHLTGDPDAVAVGPDTGGYYRGRSSVDAPEGEKDAVTNVEDVLEALRPQDDAPLADAPSGLTCTMYDYQRKALQWMKTMEENRESLAGVLYPLWVQLVVGPAHERRAIYLMPCTGTLTNKFMECPPPEPGGALCDEMGLGKVRIAAGGVLHCVWRLTFLCPRPSRCLPWSWRGRGRHSALPIRRGRCS